MEDRYWSPGQIRYTKAQVKWLISFLPLLRVGVYPRNPKESGYTDAGIQARQFKPGAKHELAVGIAADIDMRIEKAGADGLMLEFLYASEPADELFIMEHIAQCLNLAVKDVSQRIRNALYFVSGPDIKVGSYTKYIKDNHRYLKLPNPLSQRSRRL